MMRQRTVSQKKLDEVKLIKGYMEKYHVVGLAHVMKMPANSLHKLRNQLRGDVVIHMAKKKIFQRAFKEIGKPNLEEFGKEASGITALLFTNMNPISLAKFLKEKAVKGPAKPGDIAPRDIVVQAGDTKIAPGPIISEMNQHLKLPTLIKNGTIHIRQDTVTHKAGEVITEKAAQLLSRLGIEPMTIEMEFYSAWENGEIIPDAVLHANVEQILKDFTLGAAQAQNMAINLGIITPDTAIPLVTKAARDAMAVALELPIFIPDLAEMYLKKAAAQAAVLNAVAFGVPVAESTSTSSSAAPEKHEEEKKENKDEDIGAGIGSLFD